VLRAPSVVVATGELAEGAQKMKVPELPVEITLANRSGASVAFKQLDLTGVSSVVFSGLAPAQRQAVGGTVEVRLDSATGPLVGASDVIRPTDEAAPPGRFRAAIKPTSGVHDLYFVFRNEQAKGEQFLYVLLTATFESAAGSAARSGPR
jgi:cytochrome c